MGIVEMEFIVYRSESDFFYHNYYDCLALTSVVQYILIRDRDSRVTCNSVKQDNNTRKSAS